MAAAVGHKVLTASLLGPATPLATFHPSWSLGRAQPGELGCLPGRPGGRACGF